MKIGFIGYGNMAQAMVKGFKRKETGNIIYASALNKDKLLTNCQKDGIIALNNNLEVLKQSDLIILAVKPHQVSLVLNELNDYIENQIIVSIVAGLTYDKLEVLIPNTYHISICPNTPVEVNEGIIIYENKHSLNNDMFNKFKEIFKTLGILKETDGDKFNLYTTIAGCTPAFCAIFMESLADAAVMFGMSRQDSYEIASQVLVGCGKLQLESKKHPAQMKDEVTSPKGMTIKGVAKLEEKGFRSAIIESIAQIINK